MSPLLAEIQNRTLDLGEEERINLIHYLVDTLESQATDAR